MNYVAAKAITELFTPTVVLAATYVAVAATTAPSLAKGLLWGTVAVTLGSVVPFVFIMLGVRRGRLSDHHIRVRSQRHIPLVVALVSVIAGLTLLAATGAPPELTVFFSLVIGVLIPAMVITVWWQISVHTAIAALAALFMIALWGPWLVITLAMVAAVGWSRVRLDVHTIAQVWAGAALGAAVASLAWPLVG